MYIEEKIAKIASLLFALALIAFTFYLLVTTKWLVYVFAFSNVLVMAVLFILVSRQIIDTWYHKGR